MSETKVCVDLYSGLGGFSSAFRDSDEWNVISVEIDSSHEPDICADVMDLRPTDLLKHIRKRVGSFNKLVILVGQPCPLFSTAGNHDQWDGQEPVGDRAKEHVAMVYHTLGLVESLCPDYWFLENPRGRLRWILGEPTGTVTYCQYGKDYMKPTDLWGDHPPGMSYKSCARGSSCHQRNLEDDGTSAVGSMPSDYSERSKIPQELSEDILQAVEDAYACNGTEQATLDLEAVATNPNQGWI